ARQRQAQPGGQGDDGRIAEQVAQERLHCLEGVWPAEIEQDDGDFHQFSYSSPPPGGEARREGIDDRAQSPLPTSPPIGGEEKTERTRFTTASNCARSRPDAQRSPAGSAAPRRGPD